MSSVDFVLGKFPRAEEQTVAAMLRDAVTTIEEITEQGLEKAVSRLAARQPKETP
jgi:peptidyl-tRNA hydrolase